MARQKSPTEIAPNRSIRSGAISILALGIAIFSLAIFNMARDQVLASPLTTTWADPLNQVPSTYTSSQVNRSLITDSVLRYAKYQKAPAKGARLGTLTFVELGESMPIIEGTDKKSLAKGAGHYRDSVLPGVRDNSVISGHRETVFKNLKKLRIGDHIRTKTAAGVFTYQVTGTRIVDDQDRTVIVPTSEATLTLTTCYPFTPYGPKPKRYIVTARMIHSR